MRVFVEEMLGVEEDVLRAVEKGGFGVIIGVFFLPRFVGFGGGAPGAFSLRFA